MFIHLLQDNFKQKDISSYFTNSIPFSFSIPFPYFSFGFPFSLSLSIILEAFSLTFIEKEKARVYIIPLSLLKKNKKEGKREKVICHFDFLGGMKESLIRGYPWQARRFKKAHWEVIYTRQSRFEALNVFTLHNLQLQRHFDSFFSLFPSYLKYLPLIYGWFSVLLSTPVRIS